MQKLVNLDAERRVLGCLIFGIEPEQQALILSMLEPCDFGDPGCRLVREAIERLIERGAPIDELTVSSEAGSDAISATTLCQWSDVPTTANVEAWAAAVKQFAVARNLVDSMTKQIAAIVKSPGSEEVTLGAVRAISELPAASTTDLPPWSEVVDQTIAEWKAKRDGKMPSVSTGVGDIDRALNGGLRPGQLAIVAGRPGTGKSALVAQTAWRLVKCRKSVWLASGEMMASEIIERIAASETRINSSKVHQPHRAIKADSRDNDEVIETMQRVKSFPQLYICGYGKMTVDVIKAHAMRHRSVHGLDLVIVDYLQLAKGKGGSRYEEITGISRGLKNLAMELRVPVIALSQMKRAKDGANPKPHMAELRDSGQIEADADVIMLLWDEDQGDGMIECSIPKQRGGMPGITLNLGYNPSIYEFTDA